MVRFMEKYFIFSHVFQKLDKGGGDFFNLPNKRTQQWSKMTQKNVQASQSNFFIKINNEATKNII